MRVFFMLLASTVLFSISLAQTGPDSPEKKRPLLYAKRDLEMERAAIAQRNKIEEILSPQAKLKLDAVLKGFLHRLLRDKQPVTLSNLIKEEMGKEFAELTPKQSHILNFYVLAGVIKLIPPHAVADDMRSERDSLDEMNESDMLRLQQMMDKKSQLESMISNIMKAGFEG